MLKRLKNFTLHAMAGANIANIALMLLVGYSDRIDPLSHSHLAMAGLAFPIFLAVNMGFVVFWVLFRLRGVVIPLAGYLLCFGPLRTYMPFNRQHKVPEGAIKVMSYNVWNFGDWQTPPARTTPFWTTCAGSVPTSSACKRLRPSSSARPASTPCSPPSTNTRTRPGWAATTG